MAVNGTNVTDFLGGITGDAFFMSTETTATGSAQAIAHGLDFTPNRVVVWPSAGADGMGASGTQCPTITLGAISASTVTVTVTAGAKFYLLAW